MHLGGPTLWCSQILCNSKASTSTASHVCLSCQSLCHTCRGKSKTVQFWPVYMQHVQAKLPYGAFNPVTGRRGAECYRTVLLCRRHLCHVVRVQFWPLYMPLVHGTLLYRPGGNCRNTLCCGNFLLRTRAKK